MSEEGASSLGHCYVPSYHLSDLFVRDHYFQQCGASLDKQLLHLDGTDSSGVPIFFHGHTLINWAMFVAPRHPVLGRSLQNIVELVRSQFLHQSLLVITPWDKRVRNWKQVMCTTGFTLTYTVREMELEYALPDTDRAASSGCVKNKDSLFILKKEDMPRISLNNFKEYHGNVKAIWTGGDQSHYMKAMNRKNGPKLLHSYAPFSLSEYMNHLNGRAVSDEAGKSLLLVHNGSVVNFGSYQRFLNMNFTSDLVIFVPVQLLSKVPVLEHFPFPEIPVD